MAVRIGFVGVGGMGQMAHLRNYVGMDGVEIAAIAEIKPKLAETVARRYGIEKVYADHKAMLAAEKLDGVVASQPFSRHAILLPDIYPAVKCVFTEKPLAVAVEAGEKLAAAAAAAQCTHMVGYHKRSDPATAFVKGKIAAWKASGQYGSLKYVRIIMPAGDWVAAGMTGLIKSDEKAPNLQWEPPVPGMDDQTQKDYISFVNYYIHQVNLMRHMLGEPYKVAYAEKSGVLLAVESASGVAGVIEMTPYRTTVAWEEEVLVAFEKAYLKLRLFSPLTVNRAGEAEVYEDPGDGATPMRMQPALPWVHAMRQQAMNFVKVVRGEMRPPCEAAEAVEDLRIARDYILMRKALK